MAQICPATEEHIARAAALLHQGKAVAFPTETVYGLGGRTFSPEAARLIHALKGRPASNPLIAHVLDVAGAQRVTNAWSAECTQLTSAFWPGPLTLVLPRHPDVPREATGGRDTVAVRSPQHPVARALLQAVGGEPISAPSANLSGRTSATSAAHVRHDFAHVPELLILDGGACAVGIESTVLDLTAPEPTILRPGSVTAAELQAALGRPVRVREATEQGASPGTAISHYAPVTPAVLVPRGQLETFMAGQAPGCAVLMVAPHGVPPALRAHHQVFPMPELCEAYAAVLYDRLRAADASGARLIVIQDPATADPRWSGVRDRLRRATHPPAG